VLEEIKAINPSIHTSFVHIDLSSPTSVKKAAAEIMQKVSHIDVLMNSAGIMALPKYTTARMPSSGLPVELHLATNHLGHFLLASLLLPALRNAPSPRVVNITSTAFELTPFNFTDYNFSNGDTYNPWMGYGQSKTANNLFTVGLAQKVTDIQTFVLHPGRVEETGITKEVDEASWKQAEEIGKPLGIKAPAVKNLQEGCATGLVAALDPRLEGRFLYWTLLV
jgi:NAD(P)-dependent dehydrogenase (short-subunit alcohol dehydrogenase family)